MTDSHSYEEEIKKQSQRSQFFWLGFMVIILLAVITVVAIIRRETSLFERVQKLEEKPFTNSERIEIENRLLAGWVKRDLGLEEKTELEKKVLGMEASVNVIPVKEKTNIEKKLEANSF